jgi:MoxR-like ATPase
MTDTQSIAEPREGDVVAHAEAVGALFARVREGVGRVIFGQRQVIDQTLVTLLAGGHGLLIGVPGLAKTRLVETLGIVLGLDWKRIQFTPDLMPADIIGSEVLEESETGKRSFRFIKGPVFTQLLMADEINRASPRTQSALLQAMQEKHVTVAGQPFELPKPFHVLATQNPLEQEGPYPLPEAQRIVRYLPVGEKVVEAILRLVRAARPDEGGAPDLRGFISWGPGPRASQAFMLAVRAKALIEGRLAPSVDDVAELAHPVLRHRMALNFSARAEGATISDVIDRLCRSCL